jgi:hypothetical protein
MVHASNTQEELSATPLMRILGDFANSQILDAASSTLPGTTLSVARK